MARTYNHARRWGFDEELNKKIGDELRAKREIIGWSQQEVANKLGVAQKTISALETGQDNISLTKLVRYLNILGIEITVKFPLKQGKTIDIM